MDPRVELMSIIFRLAGNPEYKKGKIPSYTKDVDEHFGQFKDHPVVQLARKLREKRGVLYDAPMSLAVHVTDAFTLKEKVSFVPHPEGLDGRWRLKEVREFLQLARDFARQTNFRGFIEAHQDLYKQATARMTAIMEQHGHLEWFDRFYGEQPGARFHLFLGMLNGPYCYGPRVIREGELDMYCILGVWTCDKSGAPVFSKGQTGTVVHEFSHSYVNPLVEKYSKEFEKAGKKIFRRVEKTMIRQGYAHWKPMVHESIIRACEVRYHKTYDGKTGEIRAILDEKKRGFKWVGKLSKLLDEYEKQREKYPTLEDFMPKIVEFFNQYADQLPNS
ncbi:MAG: DUF4932 domain-containing protein [Planctomycetota bacterium]